MFVLMDMEWIINDRGHICPILIAALRVTDQWISRDSFYERMRPRDSSFYQWDHLAYTGGKASDFIMSCANAPESFYKVLLEYIIVHSDGTAQIKLRELPCEWNIQLYKAGSNSRGKTD